MREPAAEHRSQARGCETPLVIAKLFNVIFYGGYGIFYFYCGLLLRWRGVPSSLIGVVLAVRPVVGTLVTPLWTALADASGRHQSLHMCSLVVGSVSRLLYVAVPATAAPLLAAAVVSEVLTCSMTPLGDTAIVEGLKRLGRPSEDYARQRLWGAVGAGWIFVPACGALLRGRSHAASWAIALGMHIGPCVLSACMAPWLWRIGGSRERPPAPGRTAAAEAAAAAEVVPAPAAAAAAERGWAAAVGRLRSVRPSWRGAVRCVLFFWCGCFHAATEGFLFLYLDELGASTLLEGVSILCTCLSEVAVMAVAQRVLSRLGLDGCLALIFAWCRAAARTPPDQPPDQRWRA